VLVCLPVPESTQERRGQRRLLSRTPVTIRLPQEAAAVDGYTRDLSTSGIFLYANAQIRVGTQLDLVLILPHELTQGEKQWVCCKATVVRVEGRETGELGVAARIESLQALPEIAS